MKMTLNGSSRDFYYIYAFNEILGNSAFIRTLSCLLISMSLPRKRRHCNIFHAHPDTECVSKSEVILFSTCAELSKTFL